MGVWPTRCGLIAAVAAVCVAAGLGGAAPGAASPVGTQAFAPLAGPGYHQLHGGLDNSPNDVWVAGSWLQDNEQLLKHFDGTRWTHAGGLPHTLGSVLYGFAGFGPGDVWAVGNAHLRSFAAHWDGTRWTRVKTPSPGAYFNALTGVAGVAPDDLWAVGLARTDYSGDEVTVADHWAGTKWRRYKTGNLASLNELLSVSAVSSDDVWAVGGTNADEPIIEHWDGNRWSLVDQPAQGGLTSVAAVSADDVWAVGSVYTGFPPSTYAPLIDHWDGSQWSVVRVPEMAARARLYGVTATGPDDVWAVGCTLTSGDDFAETLIEHFDGKSWTRVASPSPWGAATRTCLLGVSAESPTDAWAVGNGGASGLLDRNLILHWDGSSWTRVERSHR